MAGKGVRLAALAAVLLAGAARAQDTESQSAPARDAPSRAVGGTHNCADYYPDLSRRLNETGDVLVRYDVGADGIVSNVQLVRSSGFERLDRAAVACVTQRWRNTPARHNGVAVATPNHQALIRFTLSGPSLPALPNILSALSTAPNTAATPRNAPDMWMLLAGGIGIVAVLGWIIVGLGRWVFRPRACPACSARNRPLLPFTRPGYCSSCGTKFAAE